MADIFSWGGEGLSTGALTTSSAGVGDTAPSAILGTAGPQIVAGGDRSPRLSFAASPASDQSGARWTYTATGELGVRFYFTTGSALPTSGNLPQVVWVDDAGSPLVVVDYTSTGRINLRDSATLIDQTPTSTIAADTTYRVEFTVNHGTGALTLAVYLGESTSPLDTLTGTSANLGAQSSRISFGKLNSATAPTHYIDDILVTDTATLPGPVPPTGTTTARGGRLSGSVPAGSTVARGARLVGSLPDTFDVTIDSTDDLANAEPGTTITLTASATGGTVTEWSWSASGAVITPNDDECTLTVPATLYGQDITVTATATGTGASPGSSSVVVHALPHNEWITTPSGSWAPLFANLI